MDRKRLILLAGMLILVPVIFFQLRKMGTPNVQPVQAPIQPVVEQVAKTKVLIASTDIPFGTRINDTYLGWHDWPNDIVSPDFITQTENNAQIMQEFVGGVARSEIYSGEPITKRKIVMPGEKSVMSALLRPGMRAVTTRISVDTAAGGFIQPGDNVDVILTSSMTGIQAVGGGKQYAANTIFENVRVLAIDQTFSTTSESGASVIGSTATFEMTQADSELLQQSVALGDISLTLRPLGRSQRSGQSHAKIKKNSGEVTSLTIYRNGQPTQVAVRGQ